jgi:hypothetical protein
MAIFVTITMRRAEGFHRIEPGNYASVNGLRPIHRFQNSTPRRHALCTSDRHHHRFGVVRELEVVMAPPIRTLLLLLNLLVIALLLGPLVGMFVIGSGWMFGMHLAALLWLVALTVVTATVVTLLTRGQVG